MDQPAASQSEHRSDEAWRPVLSLWDSVSLMVGIVVGTSLFASPKLVFGSVPGVAEGLIVWAVGGVLSTVGSLLFAELAVAYPRGGAYTYLTAAFGRAAGMIYGVAVLTVMLTANIGAMAFAFARYARAVLEQYGLSANSSEAAGPWLAAGAVTILALMNSRGLETGRVTQNLLTAAKLLGLGLIVMAGLWAPGRPAAPAALPAGFQADYGFAMVIVLYAFGGWSDAACVAAEVRDRSRNIPRALIGGLAAVTLIYVLVNWAYARGIGIQQLRESGLPARDVVLASGWGETAAAGVSVLVMISALGAVQGMLFSGSRAVAAMGADHGMFRALGRWNETTRAPVRAIWALASVSLIQIGLIGTTAGRSLVDAVLTRMGAQPIEWSNYGDGFDVLVIGSAPTFWILMLGVGLAFVALRWRGTIPAEFRAPGGGVAPVVYLATCGFMFWRAFSYAGMLGTIGLASCAVGAGLAWWTGRRRSPSRA